MPKKYKKEDLQQSVTLGVLLDYTDEFLIPKITEIVTDIVEISVNKSNASLKHELKEYIDQKLGDYTSDIFKRLDKKYQKDKQFKEKVVDLFKKHKIGTAEELAFLDGLVSAS